MVATSGRAGRAREEQARRRRQGRYGSRPDAGPAEGGENCLEKAADQCVMCRQCRPRMWVNALPAMLLAFARPSAGRDPAAPRPDGRSAATMYAAVRHYRAEISPDGPAAVLPLHPELFHVRGQDPAPARHGALRGGRLVPARPLRCRPGPAHCRGYRDPVPEQAPVRIHHFEQRETQR